MGLKDFLSSKAYKKSMSKCTQLFLFKTQKSENALGYIPEQCMQTGSLLQHKPNCAVTLIFPDYKVEKDIFMISTINPN